MKYCFYRMSVDSGFAPNPYYGYCTLAACTPNHMRANLEPGDVIVGVESDGLIRRRRQLLGPDTSEARCLIYYLPIVEVLDLDSYFRDPRFARKKPEPDCQCRRRLSAFCRDKVSPDCRLGSLSDGQSAQAAFSSSG